MEALKKWKLSAAGFAAGCVNGLLGAGGGMILVPLLTLLDSDNDGSVFVRSVAIMLPICMVSLAISPGYAALPLIDALPYLIGAVPGALLAGVLAKKIPVKWLHRGLGIMILWGGVRYLC